MRQPTLAPLPNADPDPEGTGSPCPISHVPYPISHVPYPMSHVAGLVTQRRPAARLRLCSENILRSGSSLRKLLSPEAFRSRSVRQQCLESPDRHITRSPASTFDSTGPLDFPWPPDHSLAESQITRTDASRATGSCRKSPTHLQGRGNDSTARKFSKPRSC